MSDAPDAGRDGGRTAIKSAGLLNGNPSGDLATVTRCGAKTRAGGCCAQPAMKNGRCRLHGGKSTGPRTAEGRERCRRANWRHGLRSVQAIAERREATAKLRALRRLLAELNPHL